MARSRHGQFNPGDVVYARWHGSIEFEVVEEIFGAQCPHYKCKTWAARKYDYWIFSQLQLSRKEICLISRDENRKQLELL